MTERAPLDPSVRDRPIGWAVVGLGKLATDRLLPAFEHCRHSRLAALVSGSPDTMRSLADRYRVPTGHLYDYTTFDRLRDDPTVDAVYIALPGGLHAEFTIRAARAGKHVLCETPMATRSEDAAAMINVCRTCDRWLMIADRTRFEPHHRSALEAVRAGELGALTSLVSDHARRLDPEAPSDRWRLRRGLAGGGSLMDLGIRGLQAARSLTGEEPIEVGAMLASPPGDERFAEVEQSASFLLRFPGGVLATGTASYGGERLQRVHAHGSAGRLELDPAAEGEGSRLRVAREGGELAERAVAPGNPFAPALDHLARCILEGTAPRTPGEEGLRDLRLLEAMYESARTGQRLRLDPETGLVIPPVTAARPSSHPGPRPSTMPPPGSKPGA